MKTILILTNVQTKKPYLVNLDNTVMMAEGELNEAIEGQEPRKIACTFVYTNHSTHPEAACLYVEESLEQIKEMMHEL